MTKIKFLSTFALVGTAVFGLTACSSSDDVAGGGNESSSEQYISVNITNVGAAGTRAGEQYEDGEAFENKVSSIRFYFFDGTGNAYTDTKTGLSYYDATPGDMLAGDDGQTVAAKTNAIIVINGIKGTTPSSMVALVNLTDKQKTDIGTGKSLRQILEAKNKTNETHVTSGGNYSNFVMSSSISFTGTTPVIAVPTVGHVESTPDAAKANPVDIYVERLDAKVRTKLNESNFANLDYKVNTAGEIDPKGTTDKTGKACEVGTLEDGTKVYALVSGWGVTDEQKDALILKGFDGISGWGESAIDNPLGFAWNDGSHHRSYWETVNAFTTGEGTSNPKQLSAYNNWNLAFGSYTYTRPNTPSSTDGFTVAAKNPDVSGLTKVGIAAQLVTKDADDKVSPAEICSFKSLQYVGLSNLNKAVLNYLWNTYKYYYSDDNGATKKPFNADAAIDVDKAITFAKLNGVGKTYQVSPQLVAPEGGVVRKYYTKSGDTYTEVEASVINSSVLGSESFVSEVRKSGMTYYYLPIRHLADNSGKIGYYGVVRNHVYDITINGITGFGTPVWNPNSSYDPLTPTDNASFVAARINVLQWRLVKQNVNIDGGKIITTP